MIGWFFILFTFALFFVSLRKAGALPFPTGLILVLGISQIVFALAHEGSITFNMLAVFNYGGLKENYLDVLALYSTIALLSLLSVIGKFKTLKSVKLNKEAISQSTGKKSFRYIVVFLLCLIFIHMVLYLFIIDWDLLWHNKVYLSSLADQTAVAFLGTDLSSTISRAVTPMSTLAAMSYAIASNGRYSLLKVLSGLTSFLYFLLLFSLHSRAAIIAPLIIMANAFVMNPEKRKLIATVMIFVLVFVLSSALEGRGRPEHGLSSIPTNIERFFLGETFNQITTVITNFCEGIFSTAEALQINDPFALRYKILAFSPLPSLIDGYSSIRAASEHRLHHYVPMPGVIEVIHFGPIYVVALFVLFFVFIRTHVKLAAYKPTAFLISNFLLLFSVYHLFAYPLRNGLRYAWIAFLISAFVLLKSRKGDSHDTTELTKTRPNFLQNVKPNE